MNISKKMIMSFIVALTSVVSMAQPYYHIMKEENGKLTEDTVYNGMDYNIKIDMNEPKPDNAIGGKITIETDCGNTYRPLKRSFYFTNKGNVYYDESKDRFFFEESQLDYPSGTYSRNHCGHFRWDRTIAGCIDTGYPLELGVATEEDFYFYNPDNLGKLQKDLGNERWSVLSSCEWRYVLNNLGETNWKVDGEDCFLIDTTPGKSLLTELRRKNGGKTSDLSIEEFKALEALGLVCLPACGSRYRTQFSQQGKYGNYWSCSPCAPPYHYYSVNLKFRYNYSEIYSFDNYGNGCAVRLVILADEE